MEVKTVSAARALISQLAPIDPSANIMLWRRAASELVTEPGFTHEVRDHAASVLCQIHDCRKVWAARASADDYIDRDAAPHEYLSPAEWYESERSRIAKVRAEKNLPSPLIGHWATLAARAEQDADRYLTNSSRMACERIAVLDGAQGLAAAIDRDYVASLPVAPPIEITSATYCGACDDQITLALDGAWETLDGRCGCNQANDYEHHPDATVHAVSDTNADGEVIPY